MTTVTTTMVIVYLLGCLVVGKIVAAMVYHEENFVTRMVEDRQPGFMAYAVVSTAILWPLALVLMPVVFLCLDIAAKVHAKRAAQHNDHPSREDTNSGETEP